MKENFLPIDKNDDAFKEILRRNKVKSISIFGSYATGEKREGSDIDFWWNSMKGLIFWI